MVGADFRAISGVSCRFESLSLQTITLFRALRQENNRNFAQQESHETSEKNFSWHQREPCGDGRLRKPALSEAEGSWPGRSPAGPEGTPPRTIRKIKKGAISLRAAPKKRTRKEIEKF
jgi:hypothetical protein